MARSALRNLREGRINERRARAGMAPYQKPDYSNADMIGSALDWAAIATAPVPIVGDIAGAAADARMYQMEPESRRWYNYALSGLGVLPFVPSASQIRKLGKADGLSGRGYQMTEIPSGEGITQYHLESPSGGRAGGMEVHRMKDQSGQLWNVSDDTGISHQYQRQGLGSGMYDQIEAETGVPFFPSSELTYGGAGFWANRNPDYLRQGLAANYFAEGTDETVRNALRQGLPDEAQREAWRAANKGDFKQYQNPVVADAAKDLQQGRIQSQHYDAIVREQMPIQPITEVPELPTFYEMGAALDTDKVNKGLIGVDKYIKDGTMVGSRLDIPAYNRFNTWVVSLHEGSGVSGSSLGYGKTAVLDDVVFNSNPKAANKVSTGEKQKAPFARMNGRWRNVEPEQAREMAVQYMNDPEWVQVGMNPYRHSFFYDKATGNPVESAERIIQIGPLVLARNAKTVPLQSPQHMIDTPAGPRFFNIAGAAALGGVAASQRGEEK